MGVEMKMSRASLFLLSVFLLLLAACSQQQGAPMMTKRIVDLSPTISEDLPVRTVGSKFLADFGYPERTTFEHKITEEPFYAADSFLTLFNHAGPHHDAPSHIIQGAASTDQFPLEKFFGRARLFDFRSKPKNRPLTRADFEGTGIQPGEVVIVLVGYTPPTDPDELPSYAYLSGEAAEYLAGIPVKAFTSDMPSLGSIRRYLQLIE